MAIARPLWRPSSKALRESVAGGRDPVLRRGLPAAQELELTPALEEEDEPLAELPAGAPVAEVVTPGPSPTDPDRLPRHHLPGQAPSVPGGHALELPQHAWPELGAKRTRDPEDRDGDQLGPVLVGRGGDHVRRSRYLPPGRRGEQEPVSMHDLGFALVAAAAAGEPAAEEHGSDRGEDRFATSAPG